MGRLDGKVAIITGAARGQGEAEARMFVSEGARVLLSDVLDDLGEKVAIDLGEGAVYRHLDVTRPDDWERAVGVARSMFGKLDILINNAGVFRSGLIESQSLEDYLAVVNVNQVGCWLGMKAVIPSLRFNGGGVIINTSSVGGFIGAAGCSGVGCGVQVRYPGDDEMRGRRARQPQFPGELGTPRPDRHSDGEP